MFKSTMAAGVGSQAAAPSIHPRSAWATVRHHCSAAAAAAVLACVVAPVWAAADCAFARLEHPLVFRPGSGALTATEAQ